MAEKKKDAKEKQRAEERKEIKEITELSRKLEKKQQELKQKEAELNELKETLQRVQAEFENYMKRIEKEKSTYYEAGARELVKKLLPVIDSFEEALKQQGSEKSSEEGLLLIYKQLTTILKQEGLEPIEAVGKGFDPYKHEAMLQAPSDRDDIILEELQKGYTFKDKVLRHSKVKVGKTSLKTQHNKRQS